MEQKTPVGDETFNTTTPRVSKYEYDFGGRLVKEIYPSLREVKNEFESDGDLMRIYGKVNANATERTYANSFSYTPDGRIEKLKLGNGLWESAKFNTRLQVTELALGHSVGDGSLWKLGYDYGELNTDGTTVNTAKNTGNIAKQTISFNGLSAPLVQTYKYDSLYRLTEARETSGTETSSPQNWKQQFSYDRYGNRLTHNKYIGTTQQTLDNKTHPTIDAATNRFNTGQGYLYDKIGNLTGDAEGRGFSFNGENKQTLILQGTTKLGEYFYDGEGKRVKKKVYNTDGITVKEETVFVYDGLGKLIAEYSTKDPPQNPTTSYTATDQLGSPRVITNALGEVISRRDFMPFGEELYNVGGERSSGMKYGATDSVRQKFTGYQRDEETGLDFAEARMYENRHARFTAVDPLLASGKSANPQTFNRYVYVMNSPLILVDPNGLQAGSHRGAVYYKIENGRWAFSNKSGEGYNDRYSDKAREVTGVDGYRYRISANGWKQLGDTRSKPQRQGGINDNAKALIKDLGSRAPALLNIMKVLSIPVAAGALPAGLLAGAGTGISSGTSAVANSPAAPYILGGLAAATGAGIGMVSVPSGDSGGLSPELSRQLGDIYSTYPSTGDSQGRKLCDCAANETRDAFSAAGIDSNIIQITTDTPHITNAAGQSIGDGFHQAVQVGDRFFDSVGHEAGMTNGATWEEYINLFQAPELIHQEPVRPYIPRER